MYIELKQRIFPVKLKQRIPLAIALILLCWWQILTTWIGWADPTAGLIDPGIWQLLLLALISFVAFGTIALYLLNLLWTLIGLPGLHSMVSHFKLLTSWQQFILYWASYALLFLGSLFCLIAVF